MGVSILASSHARQTNDGVSKALVHGILHATTIAIPAIKLVTMHATPIMTMRSASAWQPKTLATPTAGAKNIG